MSAPGSLFVITNHPCLGVKHCLPQAFVLEYTVSKAVLILLTFLSVGGASRAEVPKEKPRV